MKQYFKPWRKFINENISQIPDTILERYREGNCLLFAEAVLSLLNNEDAYLYSVITNTDGYHWVISHIVVKYAGKYIDIDGIQSEQQLKNKILHYYKQSGLDAEDIQIEFKLYNPSEWEQFSYEPEYDGEEQESFIDLNKDSQDDKEQTTSPGKMYPESPAETLKWAKIVLSNAGMINND